MTDIENKDDIKFFVDKFYGKVREHKTLAEVFENKIAENEWPKHLERMYSFWNTVLFGQPDYKGNPFSKHATLPIADGHFDDWVVTLSTVIDENFKGPKADEVKWRADKMGELFKVKLKATQNSGFKNII